MEKQKMFMDGIIAEKDGDYFLIGAKCKACGRVMYPAQGTACEGCASEDLEEIFLSKSGKLYSYSNSRRPVSGLEAPFYIGYVDLPEGPRLVSPLIIDADDEPRIGADMDIVFCDLWKDADGTPVFGYKFRQRK